MRKSSDIITRITLALSGTSMPARRLHGEDVGQLVDHARQVVDAVRVGDEGMPGLALAHLFRAPVVVADVGYRIDDLLAVHLQLDAEYAVRAGMVRPEVEEHEIRVAPAASCRTLRAQSQGLLLRVLLRVGQARRAPSPWPWRGGLCAGGGPPRGAA